MAVAVAATAASGLWHGGGSSMAAAVLRRWQQCGGGVGSLVAARQRQLGGGCRSTAAVAAAAVTALQQRNSSGCADGSLEMAVWRRCRSSRLLLAGQCGSGGSSGGSSSVTAQRRWCGVGSLFDIGISRLASLGGFGCGLECGWYFGSPFISP
jgi:hypothetical protein